MISLNMIRAAWLKATNKQSNRAQFKRRRWRLLSCEGP
jgi:hypothetical protein